MEERGVGYEFLAQYALKLLGGAHHGLMWLSSVCAEASALQRREFPRPAALAESINDDLATSGGKRKYGAYAQKHLNFAEATIQEMS
tara:strand:+ start:134190 stop:134450 length:261 start_codon:yes stop_codon:yes gene_type:complete